ncbi:MAG: PilZ domain-containing protein [Pirellulales bacterium]|nr:PilZ domain-containing protein [Pirellulales bacterium]
MEAVEREQGQELGAILERFIGGQRSKLSDKRCAPRAAYPAPLAIAPYDGELYPQQEEFVPVYGRDLSRTGISFFATEMPASELVALRLGNAPLQQVVIAARVVRVSSGYFQRRRQLIVGCQFISRLHPQ